MNVVDKRKARELCLQLMFQSEFCEPKNFIQESLAYFQKQFSLEPAIINKTSSYIDGIQRYKEDIDALIEQASAHWKISRMSFIDINIMRLAIYESQFQKEPSPPIAAINEALEISKKYSAQDSVPFINGVLDQVLKR